MSLRKTCVQGETIPRGYGIAWFNYAAALTICYPIPLNLVLQAARSLWFLLLRDHSGLIRQREVLEISNRSFQDGYKSGYSDGLKLRKRLSP